MAGAVPVNTGVEGGVGLTALLVTQRTRTGGTLSEFTRPTIVPKLSIPRRERTVIVGT